jgi:hypothetical protein
VKTNSASATRRVAGDKSFCSKLPDTGFIDLVGFIEFPSNIRFAAGHATQPVQSLSLRRKAGKKLV